MKPPYAKDYTPTPVGYQGMKALKTHFKVNPRKILDPSAGSGSFGVVFREVWPEAETHAVEPRGIESWWLSRNYDRYVIDEFHRHRVVMPMYDLIATNPPFSLWLEMLLAARKLVRPSGLIAFLGLTSWGSRSRAGVELFATNPPLAQLRITATVGFHGKGQGTDTRDYCWWIWQQHPNHDFWASFNLPRLEPEHRNWVIPPGRESAYGTNIQICEERYLLEITVKSSS